MKRFHVHIAVDDLAANIRFYSTAFGMPPAVEKADYAKWMLEDPRINFAISSRGRAPGVDHLGMQVDSEEELTALRNQVAKAEVAALDQPGAECCYARSDKYWTTDPQGIAWETFHTLGSVPVYGETSRKTAESGAAACCAPKAATIALQPASAKACC
ncbi:MAG: ArsI/CadI family heavy metal resistance metalloenzyme [Burkholderiales bacterium]